MRRADRLFELVQLLRQKKVLRAADLARQLGVSERTVYRDISDLMVRGVPIEGEAGVGYVMRAGFDLPPLMFNTTEIEALLLGARIVQSWADPALAAAARAVVDKVSAVVPAPLRHHLERASLWAPQDAVREPIVIDQAAVRGAVRERHRIQFVYRDVVDTATQRTVRPLIMAFYGPVWLLAAWCELRDGFRVFRLDRMADLVVLDDTFVPVPGQTARDFLKQDALRTRAVDYYASVP